MKVIICRKGVYNVYCTVTDSPFFDTGVKLSALRKWWGEQFGSTAKQDFESSVVRCMMKGTSSRGDDTLQDTILTNRAGDDEECLSFDDFVSQYLTIPKHEA
jgi:hypothetical protein